MNEVIEFLRQRDVPETLLQRLEYEKIACETVTSLDDETLANYVPKLGDRVALRNFCEDKNRNSNQKLSKRSNLFEVLRSKINKPDNTASGGKTSMDSPPEYRDKGKQKRKNTRRVEIGWIHNGKQVRKRTGGGTRKIDVSRSDNKTDILSEGTKLFFPEGVSSKGHISQFETDSLDFKETPLPDDVTISDCYELFKTGILTFYLHTFRRPISSQTTEMCDPQASTSSQDRLPPSHKLSIKLRSTTKNDEVIHVSSEESLAPDNLKSTSDILDAAVSAIGGLTDEDLILPDLDEPDFNFIPKSDSNDTPFASNNSPIHRHFLPK